MELDTLVFNSSFACKLHTPQASEHHHVPTRPERAEAPSPGRMGQNNLG